MISSGRAVSRSHRRIGLAIIGAGRVGRFRGALARRHPMVDWIGVCDIRPERAAEVGALVQADLVSEDWRELLARPEVTAVIIATDEHLHVEPALFAADRGLSMMIEKPLATRLEDSARVLAEIERTGTDAVVGYTQRFRRRWLSAKERVRTGALGEVTMVTSRTLMNRLVALDAYRRAGDRSTVSPMVVSGTHAMDIALWLLDGKMPMEVYARSVDSVLGPQVQGIDGTAGLITFADGAVCQFGMSWALPVAWPAAVYSLDVAILGTSGVLTIDDTHRDIVLATDDPQTEGYAPDKRRLVDFLGSYPPGDMAFGELWGPMREETLGWFDRISLGVATPHATAAEAHRCLMMTKAFDRAAQLGRPVAFPIDATG
ncbi:Gfo/Idh/MocA family protein [Roseomonas fluvialis]|uniref:Gfo/Idh/MocA family protein n=1 Tax=Roseomonas fluvialis TaxID=1750527 RepID=UPI001FCB14E9|nr:Gfo/Idh/MocA family oxidoreductase [Roseomonas fluvialis]